MLRWRILTLFLLLSLAGAAPPAICGASLATNSHRAHAARGIICEIASDWRMAVIRHEAITNYMPAMTMEFNVRNTNELNGVAAGDTIAFRLTATDNTHWIDRVRKLASGTDAPPPETSSTTPASPAALQLGDALPDCELLSEDGSRIRLSAFRGNALAFTFIFTRCPLPDFCPRMANNFAKARDLLLTTTGSPTNWQLLSVSFDPDFDKPSVLSSYASFYRTGNADRWLFAVAPPNELAELAPRLHLLVRRGADGAVSHNLRTVVLDPQGRIFRQFLGNEWTPRQLADAMQEAARTQP
jgi:protein SCO1